MRYLPHTESEIRAMIERIGVADVDALFAPIPEGYRLERPLDLEPALDEAQLMTHLEELAAKNSATSKLSFLGGGMYDHHIPPAVDQLLLRSEFYTAYTPYQPEYSQGTLQAIFEFQTLVCQLFGMEVANASMYDGASAAAEAVLMARRGTKRNRVLVSAGLHPEYLATIHTYLAGMDEAHHIEIVPLTADGRTDTQALAKSVESNAADTACVVVGYPNFFGIVEDLAAVRAALGTSGAQFITATSEMYALSLLKPPGELGVDIAVGEGQALAVPPQLGGPGVGLFSCRASAVSKMPGRLCGETVDAAGLRGYVLTLSTREQHIRRERATSNICTNHGLIALAFAIRTSMLGQTGFRTAGELCLRKAEYLKGEIKKLPGFGVPYSAPTFNEFAVELKSGSVSALLGRLEQRGILGGVALGRFDASKQQQFLVAVTERHARADLDRFISALREG
ncbi:MAG: Glycine dehydrogenase [Myxococcaceae bacterium]|nr:Glycine dehydrogenase [Myxococcaceae bacterium]